MFAIATTYSLAGLQHELQVHHHRILDHHHPLTRIVSIATLTLPTKCMLALPFAVSTMPTQQQLDRMYPSVEGDQPMRSEPTRAPTSQLPFNVKAAAGGSGSYLGGGSKERTGVGGTRLGKTGKKRHRYRSIANSPVQDDSA